MFFFLFFTLLTFFFTFQFLEYQKSIDLTKENFTFSSRVVLGDYLQAMPPEYATEGEFIRLTEEDVNRRLLLLIIFKVLNVLNVLWF